MLIRATWWVTTLVALVSPVSGCDKKPADPAAGSATPTAKGSTGSAVNAADDPWDAPPPGSNTKLGAKTGDDFAKIDPTAQQKAAPDVMRLVDKIDVAQLEKPAAEKISLKGFGSNQSAGFKVTYNPSTNETHEKYRAVFEQNRVFEQVAEGLNKTIRLPHAIDINTVSCNTINAFYDPSNQRIIMCYELVDYFLGVFKPKAKDDTELGNAVLGATIFSFFHETGHGLIHVLDLPAVGREEDSADQLATLILIAAGDEGVAMALSGAYWFQVQSESERKMPFWDEHAFDGQRFYNILCMIYGSDPDKYASFVSAGTLPKDRAQRCPAEYKKLNKAWEKLLQPHLTNGAAENVDYKPEVPVAEAPKPSSDAQDPWGEAPATPAEPAKPPPPKPAPAKPAPRNAVTCEQVARKAAELIGIEAEARARTMSEEEVEQLKAKLESELPAAIEQILAQCAKESWSDASRRCVLNAKDLAQATKCN